MGLLDIFSNDAFSVMTLTDAVNKEPFVPGRTMGLGLFDELGIPTTSVMIEEKDGVLYLVPNTPRGAPPKQNETAKRKARSLVIPHLPVGDRIMADEVQGVRAFGSDSELEIVQTVVQNRLATMVRSLDATVEHLALGAVKGLILDSDGASPIYDLFTEFGVTQEDEVDFALGAANPASGVLRQKCAAVTRQIAKNLGAASYSWLHAFCGDNFFDDLLKHKEVVDSYKNTSMATVLRDGYLAPNGSKVYGAFEFGGIVWENYRGSVGGVDFIDTDKCHIFPVGVPGLFKLYYGPADYMETVNTLGLPRYAKQAPDERFNKYVDLEVQSNPLPICTRPKVLIKGKKA